MGFLLLLKLDEGEPNVGHMSVRSYGHLVDTLDPPDDFLDPPDVSLDPRSMLSILDQSLSTTTKLSRPKLPKSRYLFMT